MSVYREGFHAIELIQDKSKRIYPDAADFGAPTKKGDEIWNWTKQLIEWYGKKETRKVIKYLTGTTVSCIVSLIDEWVTKKEFKYEVTFVSIHKNKDMDGYIYVEKIN